MPSAPAHARVALRVAAIEIRSALRDRQALVYGILLPLALYPVLFWVMLQGALVVEGERERTVVDVLVTNALPDERAGLEQALATPSPEGPVGPARVRFADEPLDGADATAALRAGDPDLVFALPAPDPTPIPLTPQISYDSSKTHSLLARSRISDRLAAYAEDRRTSLLAAASSPPPFSIQRVSLATEAEEGAFVLSLLLPMMFCVMAVLGAFFPAIDLSAGEKERGTAETTLCLPVPRGAILVGKVLAVAFFAVLATTLNVAGLLIAADHLLAGLAGSGTFDLDVPWSAFLHAAPFLLLFLLSTSAILFAIASFADTFKQGQSLLGPVQMLVLVPAMLVAMPGIDLTPALALVPVAQTTLAFKTILRGDLPALELALVAASQALYAAAALVLALRLAGAESRRLALARAKKRSWRIRRRA